MSDLDTLRRTFDQLVDALNARDADAFATLLHEQVVFFGHTSPFPVDGQATVRQGLQVVFAQRESETMTPVNPQFRVSGETGIAWGNAAVSVKPKDGPLSTIFDRYTFTFVESKGRWLVAAAHFSLLPSGN